MKKTFEQVEKEITHQGAVDISRLNPLYLDHICYFYATAMDVPAGKDPAQFPRDVYSHIQQNKFFDTLHSFDQKAFGQTTFITRNKQIINALSGDDLLALMTLHNQFKGGCTVRDMDALITKCRTLTQDVTLQANPIIVQANLDLVKAATTRKFRIFDDVLSVTSLGFAAACALTLVITTAMSGILFGLLVTGITVVTGCIILASTVAIKNKIEDRCLA